MAAKTSGGNSAKYKAHAKPYALMVEAILEEEKEILASIESNAADEFSKKMILADEMLNLVSNFVVMSGISQALLKSKDEDALNSARKSLYKGIIYLEEVVTAYVDAPFSEYKERLEAIESISPAWRYFLVRKMGLSIDLVANAYADNSKWKWTFVELKGRFATVAKNLIDLDKVVANTDPRSPHYEPTLYHLRLVKKLLALVAERFREKYELSTKSVEDFQRSLTFLSALRRLNILTGARDEAETIKKKMDIWNSKLTADIVQSKAGGKRQSGKPSNPWTAG
ncbi:MAG: hypothetical protein FWB79_01235 [Treponema sp.]|nr:hypothetical protein [Treponema sp.]